MKASPSIWNLRVYGLVIQDHKVLLTDEIQHGVRMTKFPGGGMEHGESFSECLHREFMEEMQQSIVIGDYYYHNDFLQLSAFNAQEQLISFYYKVQLIEPHHFNVVEKAFTFRAGQEQCFSWVDICALKIEELSFPIDKIVAQKLIDTL